MSHVKPALLFKYRLLMKCLFIAFSVSIFWTKLICTVVSILFKFNQVLFFNYVFSTLIPIWFVISCEVLKGFSPSSHWFHLKLEAFLLWWINLVSIQASIVLIMMNCTTCRWEILDPYDSNEQEMKHNGIKVCDWIIHWNVQCWGCIWTDSISLWSSWVFIKR